MTTSDDERWWRAHQYLTRTGAYRPRVRPTRTLFGLLVYLLRTALPDGRATAPARDTSDLPTAHCPLPTSS